jgi:hypothetical protein
MRLTRCRGMNKADGPDNELVGDPGALRRKTTLVGGVETMGLEPTTPCLQSRCSSQLSYVPKGVSPG